MADELTFCVSQQENDKGDAKTILKATYGRVSSINRASQPVAALSESLASVKRLKRPTNNERNGPLIGTFRIQQDEQVVFVC